MNQHDIAGRYFSLTEAARYLGKSPRWLQYQLSGPTPPPGYQVPSATSSEQAKKAKKAWLFRKSELDRWVEQFRAGSDLDKLVDEVMNEVAR